MVERSDTTGQLTEKNRTLKGLVRGMFRVGFSDAQCGFKAITRAAARELVPLVEDNGWFFDTELLLEAERLGHRIVDVPVEWREDADSRVRVLATARGGVKGLVRMRWRRLVGARESQQAKEAGR